MCLGKKKGKSHRGVSGRDDRKVSGYPDGYEIEIGTMSSKPQSKKEEGKKNPAYPIELPEKKRHSDD